MNKEHITPSDGEIDLRTFLSETFVLYMKTSVLHWNYEGAKFYGVHKLTETQYADMAEAIDSIAERMRALGDKTPVSLKQILEHSGLKEFHHAQNDAALKDLVHSNRKLSALAVKVAKVAEEKDDIYTHDMQVQLNLDFKFK